LGKGYRDSQTEIDQHGILSDSTKVKSIVAKCFGDHLSFKLKFLHNKGLLLELFLTLKENWVGDIFVFDDNSNVIKDVTKKIGELSVAEPKIVMIPVVQVDHPGQYFDDYISPRTTTWARLPFCTLS
jgi:hypothetical protein